MQGGIREGAGRKVKQNKKLTKNICLTPEKIATINSLTLRGCKILVKNAIY